MTHVTVTSKYRITIPLEVRRRLGIKRGQRFSVIAIDDVIELVPERDIKELRGAFPQLSVEDIREETDRL